MKALITTIQRGKHKGQFKFILIAKNGETIAQSYPESYTTLQKCKQTLKRCFPAFEIHTPWELA
ncbi:MAG: YegP family protein [Bacteroidota bacterium]